MARPKLDENTKFIIASTIATLSLLVTSTNLVLILTVH